MKWKYYPSATVTAFQFLINSDSLTLGNIITDWHIKKLVRKVRMEKEFLGQKLIYLYLLIRLKVECHSLIRIDMN